MNDHRNDQRLEEGVDRVAPHQERRHAVGDPQRAGEERPLQLLDDEEAPRHQRTGGFEAPALQPAPEVRAAQLQRQAGARPPPGHVVLEVGQEALEARVEVGGERDKQEVEVGALQAERPGQAPQAQVGPSGLCGVRLRLEPIEEPGGLRVRAGAAPPPRPSGQQLVDVALRDVEATEAVVRVRIALPPVGDHPADLRLDDGKPATQVPEGRVGVRTHLPARRAWPRWATSGPCRPEHRHGSPGTLRRPRLPRPLGPRWRRGRWGLAGARSA